MPLNSLFPQGAYSEQNLTEDLIIESIRQYGKEFYYIPRKLVALDKILGEDTLSKFENAYPIECYIDNVDGYGGNGAFMSKFGLFIEEQGRLTISRRRWEQLVGQWGETLIPTRPAEGDLLYFPLTKGLFDIKYVEHQNPFYQLGKLYVYKLNVELFQYSSERVNTEIDELNDMAMAMTFDILGNVDPEEHADPQHRNSFVNAEFERESLDVLSFDEKNPFGE